jgi:ribokinase
MDLVVRSQRIPSPGETVLGEGFRQIPGGKGANQAVAAARLGAEVTFVGRVGADLFGEALRAGMQADGIDTAYLRTDPTEPTGVALIGVDAAGRNAITVASGANFQVSPADVEEAWPRIAGASALLLQLEIPIATVLYAAQRAHEAGIRVLLNPAPVSPTDPLPASLLALIDVLTPNEHEAAALTGWPVNDASNWNTIAVALLARGVRAVVITLGEAGCLAADASGVTTIAGVAVQAVDTTAAGDCFTGALAVALAEGCSLIEAARFAGHAAAISVTRPGAQPSLPTRAEVEAARPTERT